MGECPHFKMCCPVVWDKSGEPMTKEIKIRCDDCKFVEDCVDYGWDVCKKFTSKPSEPMTNEEWFCTLTTEEKAEWLSNTFDLCGAGCRKCFVKELCFNEHINKMPSDLIVEWLKQPHK